MDFGVGNGSYGETGVIAVVNYQQARRQPKAGRKLKKYEPERYS
jgi:hypothetical protein